MWLRHWRPGRTKSAVLLPAERLCPKAVLLLIGQRRLQWHTAPEAAATSVARHKTLAGTAAQTRLQAAAHGGHAPVRLLPGRHECRLTKAAKSGLATAARPSKIPELRRLQAAVSAVLLLLLRLVVVQGGTKRTTAKATALAAAVEGIQVRGGWRLRAQQTWRRRRLLVMVLLLRLLQERLLQQLRRQLLLLRRLLWGRLLPEARRQCRDGPAKAKAAKAKSTAA